MSEKVLSIVSMFGRRRWCKVEPHGVPFVEYPVDKVLWVERAEDHYGIASFCVPFCVLDREDWLQGKDV